MKQLLIYLLIPCLFFVQGNNAKVAVAHQHISYSSADNKAQNNRAGFTTSHQKVYLSELSFITDDNDDEEFSNQKKKVNSQASPAVYNIAFSDPYVASYLKITSLSFNNICCSFPSKYILHRTIRI